MSASAFVVEFVGLRGVGKSTLAGEVVRALRERGTPCNRPEPLGLPHRLALRLEYYSRLATGFALVAGLRPISWTELRRCARAYSVVGHRLAWCRRASGVHLLDEGVFQLAARIHLCTRAPDIGMVSDTLLRRLSLPDLVVVVEAPQEVVEGRRRLRGTPRDVFFKDVPPEAVGGLKDLKAMLQGLSLSAGMGYLEVANNDGTPPRAAAAPVVDLILERCRAGRSARR